MISFTVVGRPQGKGRPRMRKDGHVFTPVKTVRYENLIAHCAAQAMAGRAPLLGPLVLSLAVYVPVPQSWPAKRRNAALLGVVVPETKPDIDNAAKALLDAINGVVFVDDKQVAVLNVRKLYGTTPRLEISVSNYF